MRNLLLEVKSKAQLIYNRQHSLKNLPIADTVLDFKNLKVLLNKKIKLNKVIVMIAVVNHLFSQVKAYSDLRHLTNSITNLN